MIGVYILDELLTTVHYCDDFSDFIWTERFSEPDDFELHVPYNLTNLEVYKPNRFLYNYEAGFKGLMVIESVDSNLSRERRYEIVVRGKGLESVLRRRVTSNVGNYAANSENLLFTFLEDVFAKNIGAEASDVRKMPNISLRFPRKADSSYLYGNPRMEKITAEDYSTMNMYEMFAHQLSLYGFGLRSYLGVDPRTGIITAYKGEDRSLDVLFSKDMGNLKGERVGIDVGDCKNVITYTDGEGKPLYTYDGKVLGDGMDKANAIKIYGLNRFEDVAQQSDNQQKTLLEGKKNLAQTAKIAVVEAQAISNEKFKQTRYGTDFSVGDIVSIKIESNIYKVVVESYISSYSENGVEEYPTLAFI